MRRYAVLGFDLDGTLVDTAGEIGQAVDATLAEFAVPARSREQVLRLIGGGTRELVHRLLAEMMRERPLRAARLAPGAVLERFERHYAALAGRSARPYPGCRDTLERLREGGVRLACVTNKEARFAERVLEGTRLAQAFDLVVAGDSLPRRKPHASVLAHVLERFDAGPQQAAHVGDSSIDVETARHAGVAAWAVPWGYNNGNAIEDAAPDRLFASLPEIADVVLEANARRRSGTVAQHAAQGSTAHGAA